MRFKFISILFVFYVFNMSVQAYTWPEFIEDTSQVKVLLAEGSKGIKIGQKRLTVDLEKSDPGCLLNVRGLLKMKDAPQYGLAMTKDIGKYNLVFGTDTHRNTIYQNIYLKIDKLPLFEEVQEDEVGNEEEIGIEDPIDLKTPEEIIEEGMIEEEEEEEEESSVDLSHIPLLFEQFGIKDAEGTLDILIKVLTGIDVQHQILAYAQVFKGCLPISGKHLAWDVVGDLLGAKSIMGQLRIDYPVEEVQITESLRHVLVEQALEIDLEGAGVCRFKYAGHECCVHFQEKAQSVEEIEENQGEYDLQELLDVTSSVLGGWFQNLKGWNVFSSCVPKMSQKEKQD